MTYRVNDIYRCIQGEGCQTGVPMVLLRLHGCGVGCAWCDTKETWQVDRLNRVDSIAEALGTNSRWTDMGEMLLALYIRQEFPGPNWVLLTGGEPAEQDLAPLVAALQCQGYKVAIETSGTALGHVNAGADWVCVSPKFVARRSGMHGNVFIDTMPGCKALLAEAMAEADEFKVVVGREDDITVAEDLLATTPFRKNVTVCLQPVSASPKATELCIRECERRGWRLSVQTHKLLSLR